MQRLSFVNNIQSFIIRNMFFPIDSNIFFAGSGHYVDVIDGDAPYLGTDSGYMRHLLFYGLPPSLLLYCLYLFGFVYLGRLYRNEQGLPTLFILMGFYYFVVHLKGDFLTGSGMSIKLFFILLIFSLLDDNKQLGRR